MKQSLSYSLWIYLLGSFILAGCISDPGVNKKRGSVKDFSIVNTSVGCNSRESSNILILPDKNGSSTYTCTNTCPSETSHLATLSELATIKSSASSEALQWIENSSGGVCVANLQVAVRPTNAIDIKSDFCSCINGKSDIINDCSSFCANVANSASPILYVNTLIGTDVALNTNLGNLYNWCNVQLAGDSTSPQCFLSATDGNGQSITNIPVTINPNSNSFSANIAQLALNKTYIIKIYEGKTGSNAQSKEFQLRRKTQPIDDPTGLGALKVSPINQYTCINYSLILSNGVYSRTNYARSYYYFVSNESPPPVPPATPTTPQQTVCHDDQLHPGNDNIEYPRLELIPKAFALWDRSDPRFINENNSGLAINKTITSRLQNEFNVTATIDLFRLLPFLNHPSTSTTSSASVSLGYIMVPFVDKAGKAYCPTQTEFNSPDQPLFNVLKDYMDDTEGIYFSEKEAEIIQEGSVYKTLYAQMLVTETILKKYGFYVENGIKIKASAASMNTKTIYFYWPANETMDPLLQGNRKLFTVRSVDALNGNTPSGISTSLKTSDKRIGCIPKS